MKMQRYSREISINILFLSPWNIPHPGRANCQHWLENCTSSLKIYAKAHPTGYNSTRKKHWHSINMDSYFGSTFRVYIQWGSHQAQFYQHFPFDYWRQKLDEEIFFIHLKNSLKMSVLLPRSENSFKQPSVTSEFHWLKQDRWNRLLKTVYRKLRL